MNHQIDNRTVRLIDADGVNVGVVDRETALRKADEAGLDLVEISPNADPPVCKILDIGKYKYEEQKRKNEARKKQKIVEIKEIKMRPNIDDNDYDVKMRSIRRFFEDGDGFDLLIHLIIGAPQRDHGRNKLRVGFQTILKNRRCLTPHAGLAIFFGQRHEGLRSRLRGDLQGQSIDFGRIRGFVGA